MQIYEGQIANPGEGKIAIVVSKFNKTVTESLLNGAVETLKNAGVKEDQIVVAWVPGAFEIPTIASLMAEDESYIAILCLGCVIKGETPHDTYIASAVSAEIARLGADTGIPVIFGLLTCNTNEQALARAGLAAGSESQLESGTSDKILGENLGNKGVEAAQAALEMLSLIEQFPEPVVSSDDDDAPVDRENLARRAAQYRAGEYDSNDDSFDDDEFADDFDDDEDDEEFEEFDDEISAPRGGRYSQGSDRGGYRSSAPKKSGGKFSSSHSGSKPKKFSGAPSGYGRDNSRGGKFGSGNAKGFKSKPFGSKGKGGKPGFKSSGYKGKKSY